MRELLGQEGLINTVCTKIAWILICLVWIEMGLMVLTSIVALIAIYWKKL